MQKSVSRANETAKTRPIKDDQNGCRRRPNALTPLVVFGFSETLVSAAFTTSYNKDDQNELTVRIRGHKNEVVVFCGLVSAPRSEASNEVLPPYRFGGRSPGEITVLSPHGNLGVLVATGRATAAGYAGGSPTGVPVEPESSSSL